MKVELIRRSYNKGGPVDLMGAEAVEAWVEPGVFVEYKGSTLTPSKEDKATHVVRGIGGGGGNALVRCEVLGVFQPEKSKKRRNRD